MHISRKIITFALSKPYNKAKYLPQKYMSNQYSELDLLIEISWEVCNKIGGIYTVLSTKAKNLQKLYKDKVVFIGPDVWSEQTPCPYFIESPTPLAKWANNVRLPYGITVRVGRWDIPGKPIAVLVGFETMYALNNDLFGHAWKKFGVDSLRANGDYPEACAFSHAAALVAESIVGTIAPQSPRTVVHLNEWTTGMALLHVKEALPRTATIFTTHATTTGRSICGNGKCLYQYLPGYNGTQMSAELGVEAKHSLEQAAAKNADCFTTVSDITAQECAQILDTPVHVVTPNGFEQNFVPKATDMPRAIAASRTALLATARALTGKNIPDDAFIISTSGRCEYRNKGIDMYIESVKRLAALHPSRHVLAYIMVPAWVKEPRADLQEALATNGKIPATKSGTPQSNGTPLLEPALTHWLHNPDQDPILAHIRHTALPSNFTLIYTPCYLNGNDGIFNLPYYDLLPGLDATVFPSYYEPWGYTPLESIAFGVPTVTTSLSGFGRWIMSLPDHSLAATGVAVAERTDTNFDQCTAQIAQTLLEISNLNKTQTKKLKAAATKTAKTASWNNFITKYQEAFETALANTKTRNNF